MARDTAQAVRHMGTRAIDYFQGSSRGLRGRRPGAPPDYQEIQPEEQVHIKLLVIGQTIV